MAYLLTMADIQAILKLHEQGWPQRRIARELDVDRETVAKYIRRSRCVPKPANAPLGSEGVGDQVAGGPARPVVAEACPKEKGVEAHAASPLSDVPPGPFKTSQSASRWLVLKRPMTAWLLPRVRRGKVYLPGSNRGVSRLRVVAGSTRGFLGRRTSLDPSEAWLARRSAKIAQTS
jgi:hypothetical protein